MLDLALDNRLFIYDDIDEALQELDLLFNTENTELIGTPAYGTNFEQFLWTMTPSVDSLKSYIEEKIKLTTVLANMDHNIEVEILNGQYRSIYQVSITVYYSGKAASREYQFR